MNSTNLGRFMNAMHDYMDNFEAEHGLDKYELITDMILERVQLHAPQPTVEARIAASGRRVNLARRIERLDKHLRDDEPSTPINDDPLPWRKPNE